MADTRTRRQKVKAMAEQAASPEEAAVAAAMLATMEDDRPRLEVIADEVKSEWGKGIEAQFAIGRLLMEARQLLPGNVEFGKWVDQQGFSFSRQVAWRLRVGAEREDEVRALLVDSAQKQRGGPEPTVSGMVQRLIAGPKKEPIADGSDEDDAGELLPVTDATPADPAYVALRSAAHAIVGVDGDTNAFLTMHVDDLAKSAGFIKALAVAYNAAKAERGG